ncbi:MAG: ZIP family metal transporter [Thermoguttaceae bacterium]|nr:ZIP family metal transporter [Thermoguttaceae bacterium]
MLLAFLTALGVGGATLVGSAFGFAFQRISHRFSDVALAFAAGVMLAAATFGLILPAVEDGGRFGLPIAIVGIFVGAYALTLVDKFVPHLHRLIEPDGSPSGAPGDDALKMTLLFVVAIAIHNGSEGLAAGVGVGFGDAGETSRALVVAGGIALQNIPEGLIVVSALLAAGVSARKTLACALASGLVEVVGVPIGYGVVSFAAPFAPFVLPFALAFAGGAMLYVVSDEMIPETHAHGAERGATYSLLAGFCIMLAADALLG